MSSLTADVSPLARWPRLLGYLRPHRGVLLGTAALGLCVAALNALEPLVLKHLFDSLAARSAARAIAATLGVLLGLAAVRELGAAAAHRLTWRTRLKLHFALTSEAVGRLHGGPVGSHREQRAGATLMRLDRGVQSLLSALSEVMLSLLPAVAYLGVAAAVMVRLEWRLALVVLACSPLPALLARRAAPEQTLCERNLLERWTRIYARFSEVLLGIVTAKEETELDRLMGDVGAANGVVSDGVGRDVRVGGLQNLAMLLARGAALAGGAALVLHGSLSPGSLVAFLGYAGGVFTPAQSLSGVHKTFRLATASMDQVFGLIDAKGARENRHDARVLDPVRGDVEFRRLRFAYPSGGAPLIDGVQLEVRAGESVALVGPSGAGKSTLMSLLQRLYDPTEGQVLVDGHDVRDVHQHELRRHLGVVLQDTPLSNETVRDHITYGVRTAPQEQIEAAARTANVHELIARLPRGYDTVVGDRGVRLSAGERQRVAIARALLKDPRILILEEPTAALDAESEALLQDALGTLMKGRTTFIVARRLSTVTQVDRVVVLQKGRLVEQGTHEKLLERGGYYAALVARQTKGMFPARMPVLVPVRG